MSKKAFKSTWTRVKPNVVVALIKDDLDSTPAWRFVRRYRLNRALRYWAKGTK